jgi:16S rRNA (guanine(966)-N(2))-methyltransferase RsmD
MGELNVIGGKAGGFSLKSVPGNITRPVMAKVKKAVFDIATPYVYDSSWLDLFAGTGSVGIEALSRGARFVRFVDIHPAAVKTIHENLTDVLISSISHLPNMNACGLKLWKFWTVIPTGYIMMPGYSYK